MTSIGKTIGGLCMVFLIAIMAILGVRTGDEVWYAIKKGFGWKPKGGK